MQSQNEWDICYFENKLDNPLFFIALIVLIETFLLS